MTSGVNPKTGKHYRFKNRQGTRNGRLVFIRVVGVNIHKHQIWEAVCDCGNIVETSSAHKTKSCGCLQREKASLRQIARKLPPEIKKQRIRDSAKKQRLKQKSCKIKSMQSRLSRLHRHALNRIGVLKTSPTFEELGYTVDDFVKHIEKQFIGKMSWENMNLWQIDHITPVSSAKTTEDVFALNQLSNLRPMWAVENNKKNNKKEFLL